MHFEYAQNALLLVALFFSLWCAARRVLPAATQGVVDQPTTQLALIGVTAAAVCLVPIGRFPWMDEAAYALNGMRGLEYGEWAHHFSELSYTWSLISGLAASLVHPLVGPRLCAVAFGVATIPLVYVLTAKLQRLVPNQPEHDRWPPLVAALVFGLSGPAIYLSSLAIHGAMAMFLLQLSICLLFVAHAALQRRRRALLFAAVHVCLIAALLTKYSIAMYAPVVVTLSLALTQAHDRGATPSVLLRRWCLNTVAPLLLLAATVGFVFLDDFVAGYRTTREVEAALFVLTERTALSLFVDAVLPTLGLAWMSGVVGMTLPGRRTWAVCVTLLLGGAALVVYHLSARNNYGLYAHMAYVLALAAPVSGMGIVAIVRALAARVRAKLFRLELVAAAILVVLAPQLTVPFSSANYWWQEDRGYRPTEAARAMQRIAGEGPADAILVDSFEGAWAFFVGMEDTQSRRLDPRRLRALWHGSTLLDLTGAQIQAVWIDFAARRFLGPLLAVDDDANGRPDFTLVTPSVGTGVPRYFPAVVKRVEGFASPQLVGERTGASGLLVAWELGFVRGWNETEVQAAWTERGLLLHGSGWTGGMMREDYSIPAGAEVRAVTGAGSGAGNLELKRANDTLIGVIELRGAGTFGLPVAQDEIVASIGVSALVGRVLIERLELVPSPR